MKTYPDTNTFNLHHKGICEHTRNGFLRRTYLHTDFTGLNTILRYALGRFILTTEEGFKQTPFNMANDVLSFKVLTLNDLCFKVIEIELPSNIETRKIIRDVININNRTISRTKSIVDRLLPIQSRVCDIPYLQTYNKIKYSGLKSDSLKLIEGCQHD